MQGLTIWPLTARKTEDSNSKRLHGQSLKVHKFLSYDEDLRTAKVNPYGPYGSRPGRWFLKSGYGPQSQRLTVRKTCNWAIFGQMPVITSYTAIERWYSNSGAL
ncbi:hypothetical protein HanIR_Chr15g0777701 [Helianthus annuus]|nr:hypothetical protein HanIR_Chr15g0777701 [Helianthus annuus]